MNEPASEPVPWLTQLRRRGVLRVATSYGAIAWLLIQIGGAVADPLGLPPAFLKALIIVAVLGFPVALLLAWYLEFTPGGIAVDRERPGASRPAVTGIRRYADLLIIGVLVIVVGLLVARQPEVAGLGHKSTVAVLPFENLSIAAEGEVLASGIAESVLHQLANLRQIDVISRTSSFAFRGKGDDAKSIGQQLHADFLLEGSIQRDRARLRVTTQLIDARTGADVWSMRFDRGPSDIFAVQDEIAVQVTRALELTLDSDAAQRMKGQGTENLDAYLAYLQGRYLLASDRVSDVAQAITYLEHAIELDPKFAAGYVGLAEAGLFVAEYEVTEDRSARFNEALNRGGQLVKQALAVDPKQGEAYLVRASIESYTDLRAAEADYRRGLQLSPNSAKGYAGLAAVLYETPSRRNEALALVDRARKLDPLQPEYAVTRAVFLSYERGDVQGADQLLSDVVRQNPDYLPGLTRLSELRAFSMGRSSDGIEYGERALALDPLSESTRHCLIRAYLDVDDAEAAEHVADAADNDLAVRRIPILLYRHDWRRAGEAAYESLAKDTVSPMDGLIVVAAITMHARVTHDFERARSALESLSEVTWDASGQPAIPDRPATRDAAIGLASVLLAGRQPELGKKLLDVIIGRMRLEIEQQGRSEFWYLHDHPVALAMRGEREAALAMLQRSLDANVAYSAGWYFFDVEPAYDGLRSDPSFQAMRAQVLRHAEQQRRELDRARAAGRVPDRSKHPADAN